jgi:hypothetical protein
MVSSLATSSATVPALLVLLLLLDNVEDFVLYLEVFDLPKRQPNVLWQLFLERVRTLFPLT